MLILPKWKTDWKNSCAFKHKFGSCCAKKIITTTSVQSQRLKMIRTCSLSMNSNAIVIRLYFVKFISVILFFLFSASYANAPQSPFVKSMLEIASTLYKCLLEIQIHSSKMRTGQYWQLETVKECYWFFFFFGVYVDLACWSVCSCRASRSISFDLKYASSFRANVFYKLY